MPLATLTLRPSPVELIVAAEDEPAARPRDGARLHRVRHRVYAPADRWQRLQPWERYLARVHAVLALRPDAVPCLESAAALLGLPVFGEPRDVHLFDIGAPKTHRVGDVVRHTSKVAPTVLAVDGVMLVSPSETAAALARALPPAFGLAVADAAVSPRQRDLTTLDALHVARSRTVDSRGIRVLDWVLASVDPDAESTGESVSRAVIEWLGFPRPELQQEFRLDGHTDRVDFWWPGEGIVGESDGYGKYPADPESARIALIREKRREDRLRRHVGPMARWDWADTLRVRPLEHALFIAGLPRVRQPQRLMLATLRSNRRSR